MFFFASFCKGHGDKYKYRLVYKYSIALYYKYKRSQCEAYILKTPEMNIISSQMKFHFKFCKICISLMSDSLHRWQHTLKNDWRKLRAFLQVLWKRAPENILHFGKTPCTYTFLDLTCVWSSFWKLGTKEYFDLE
jgi:hypothetical protein